MADCELVSWFFWSGASLKLGCWPRFLFRMRARGAVYNNEKHVLPIYFNKTKVGGVFSFN